MSSAPILVPVDGSDLSEQAIPLAASIAERRHAPLRLVRVHVPLSSEVHCADGLVAVDDQRDRDARARDTDYLERLRAASGAGAQAVLAEGLGVAAALAADAERTQAQLVVMTTHGRTGLPRLLHGSVVAGVVRNSPAPVLVMHGGKGAGIRAFRRVLVPLDGSALARSILCRVSEVAEPGARLVLSTVIEPGDSTYWRDAAGTPARDEQDQVESARRRLEEEAAPLRARGFEVKTWIARSRHCAGAILAAAHEMDAQLIALATHGRSGLMRAALGSVAEAVVRGADVPVLLHHPSQRSR